MKRLRFEWDEAKNATNRKKHGISFEEATTVFADEHALLLADPDPSSEEDRFVLMGFSSSLRMLVVCHCSRREGHVIRIISARKATRTETYGYTRRWRK
jgi:uncharacterized DUF497 family protein